MSLKEIIEIVNEEKLKLGLADIDVSVKIRPIVGWIRELLNPAYVVKKVSDEYEIRMNEGILNDEKGIRMAIKHELYRIYKKDLSSNPNFFRLILQESRATMYECFGLKL